MSVRMSKKYGSLGGGPGPARNAKSAEQRGDSSELRAGSHAFEGAIFGRNFRFQPESEMQFCALVAESFRQFIKDGVLAVELGFRGGGLLVAGATAGRLESRAAAPFLKKDAWRLP